MFRSLVAILTLATALPAVAQSGSTPPQRIRSVTLTGTQTCPVAVGDEVVVCSRIEAGQQYRIPKELRDAGPVDVKNQSFAAKTDRLDEVGRQAAGLPDTCSPVGTGGQTGCTRQLLEQSAADKRAGSIVVPR